MSAERNYLVTVGLVEIASRTLVASALCGATFEGTAPLCEVAEAANLVQLAWRWPEDYIGGSEFTNDAGLVFPISADSYHTHEVVVLAVERAPEEVKEGHKLVESA